MAGVKGKGGKKGVSGRKPKEQSDELKSLLDQAWPQADRLRAIRKHAEQANEGNVRSFNLLLTHAYGTPVQRHEYSNPDGSGLFEPFAQALMKVYGSGTKSG